MRIKNITMLVPWYEKNFSKILFVIILHFFIITILLKIPYINLLNIYFFHIAYFIDILVLWYFFRPQKQMILKIGIFIFVFSIVPTFLHMQVLMEAMGEAAFYLLAAYVVLSLRELRDNTTKV